MANTKKISQYHQELAKVENSEDIQNTDGFLINTEDGTDKRVTYNALLNAFNDITESYTDKQIVDVEEAYKAADTALQTQISAIKGLTADQEDYLNSQLETQIKAKWDVTATLSKLTGNRASAATLTLTITTKYDGTLTDADTDGVTISVTNGSYSNFAKKSTGTYTASVSVSAGTATATVKVEASHTQGSIVCSQTKSVTYKAYYTTYYGVFANTNPTSVSELTSKGQISTAVGAYKFTITEANPYVGVLVPTGTTAVSTANDVKGTSSKGDQSFGALKQSSVTIGGIAYTFCYFADAQAAGTKSFYFS